MSKRQLAYAERQRQKGLVTVRVWVPAEDADKLKTYARELSEKRLQTPVTR